MAKTGLEKSLVLRTISELVDDGDITETILSNGNIKYGCEWLVAAGSKCSKISLKQLTTMTTMTTILGDNSCFGCVSCNSCFSCHDCIENA